jgi:ribose transport system substrate-binding protein
MRTRGRAASRITEQALHTSDQPDQKEQDVNIDRRLKRRIGVGVAIVLVASALAACSSSKGSSAPVGSTSATSSAPADAGLTEAVFTQIANLYVNPPPTTGPKPVKNKNIWWMGCGNSVPACKLLSDAGGQAAKLLGWNFHVADGNLNQNGGYATAIRTALAAKPDALVIQGMDCGQIEQPLQEAKAQGVPVLGVQSIDCSDETSGAPSLISVQYEYSNNAKTLRQYYEAFGQVAAKYLIAKENGKAQVIANLGKGGFYEYMNDGFRSVMATCSACKIVDEVRWADADTAPNGPWVHAFSAALAKDATANSVFIPFDSLMTTSGGIQAIKDSGRKVDLVGANGNDPATIQAVRDGQLTAITAAQDFRWLSYGAIDELNRLFNKQPSVPEGIGPTLVDQTHGLPAAGQAYTSTTDFVSLYKTLWGV